MISPRKKMGMVKKYKGGTIKKSKGGAIKQKGFTVTKTKKKK